MSDKFLQATTAIGVVFTFLAFIFNNEIVLIASSLVMLFSLSVLTNREIDKMIGSVARECGARFESSGRWFFAFWIALKDNQGRWLMFPSVSLGFFRIAKDTSEPWYCGWYFFLNNDD